jgi:hypothetical protein
VLLVLSPRFPVKSSCCGHWLPARDSSSWGRGGCWVTWGCRWVTGLWGFRHAGLGAAGTFMLAVSHVSFKHSFCCVKYD